jgi:hypothetical protein
MPLRQNVEEKVSGKGQEEVRSGENLFLSPYRHSLYIFPPVSGLIGIILDPAQ